MQFKFKTIGICLKVKLAVEKITNYDMFGGCTQFEGLENILW